MLKLFAFCATAMQFLQSMRRIRASSAFFYCSASQEECKLAIRKQNLQDACLNQFFLLVVICSARLRICRIWICQIQALLPGARVPVCGSAASF